MKFILGIICTLLALVALNILVGTAEKKIAYQYQNLFKTVLLDSVNDNVITSEQSEILKQKFEQITAKTEYE